MNPPPGIWTNLTLDTNLVQHLLNLYFCWEYPTLASMSREHFQRDFESGRPRFCSRLLVNALLALGSRFSDRIELRADPDDQLTAGDAFFDEARRLFWNEPHHQDVTTVQALGIMSIREASSARDVDSRYYAGQSLRLAIEMGLHRTETDGADDEESYVRLITFWGAFNLDQAWSITTGCIPRTSRFPRLPPKVVIVPALDNELWAPYTDDGSALEHPCEQPCHIRSVYNCFCELNKIVHEAVYLLHCPAKTPTSQDMLHVYGKYLDWYNNMPEILRLGANFTPQVLFVHLYYHFSVALIFRPFIKLRICGSNILPGQLCAQAADALQAHMQSYSKLYTLRRTPSFAPYLVLASSRLSLAIDDLSRGSQRTDGAWQTGHPLRRQLSATFTMGEHTAEALRRGISTLQGMTSCHRAATVALSMLRYLAEVWGIYVEIRGAFEEGQGYKEFDSHWAAASITRGPELFAGLADVERAGEMLKSALFWPGPRQSPDVVPQEQRLEDVGFETL